MSHLTQVALGRPTSVFVGSADAGFARVAHAALGAGVQRVGFFDRPDALKAQLAQSPADLVILAFEAAESVALCRDLTSEGELPRVHVLIVLTAADEEGLERAFSAGASDVLTWPLEPPLLRCRVRARIRAHRELKELYRKRAQLENAQRIAGVGSWELDVSTREMRWSPQTFQVLGLAEGEVKTNLENLLLCVHPADRDGVVEQLNGALGATRGFDLGHRVVIATGAVRHVELRGELVPDALGRYQGTIQDVTEQKRAEEKIRQLAHYDHLTGLSNRLRFKEQLERSLGRARAQKHHMALLYMDLDQFKRINDTLGHSAGDHLLRHVAEVLFDKVRATDFVGRSVVSESQTEISRLGGDEFAVVLSEVAAVEDAGQVASRILEAVTAPIQYEEHEISTTASIGIAVFPDDGEDLETLVKHADAAMYSAKERGRNNYQFFSEKAHAGELRRLTLESHLRNALDGDQLRVVYQPKLDLKSRTFHAVEALVRWDQPTLGPVQPGEFIPVAEETGLILPIGSWVLRTSCEQAKAWRVSGFGKVRMAVNVSSRQVARQDIRATVTEILTATGMDPHQLELEITESLVLEDDENTGTSLRELKAMGVRIVLDDFGTGYSSLSYLSRFPLDGLKLDRSLVRDVGRDPSSRGIAKAVIQMAHAVGLTVTAEGVDEAAQARFLLDEGCDELQGFLLSGPVTAEECARYFEPDPNEPAMSPAEWDAIFASD